MNINTVFISGRIGHDSELRYTAQGLAVTNFSLAYQKYKKGAPASTYWFKIVVFGKLAESCAYFLKKGNEILVQGELQTRNFMTNQSEEKVMTEIIADQLKFIAVSSNSTFRAPSKPSPERVDFDSVSLEDENSYGEFEKKVDSLEIPF
jgi:single-strand DNA-binding protein